MRPYMSFIKEKISALKLYMFVLLCLHFSFFPPILFIFCLIFFTFFLFDLFYDGVRFCVDM